MTNYQISHLLHEKKQFLFIDAIKSSQRRYSSQLKRRGSVRSEKTISVHTWKQRVTIFLFLVFTVIYHNFFQGKVQVLLNNGGSVIDADIVQTYGTKPISAETLSAHHFRKVNK